MVIQGNGAVFSPCRRWRYALVREWGGRGNMCMFVGLNPSTADASTDDPTVRRFTGFARKWGFSGVYALNLFAYRATLPSELKKASDPVGSLNDLYLNIYREKSEQVIVAWGIHGEFRDRDGQVLGKGLLGEDLYCLGLTKHGHPRHPLYLPGATERERYDQYAGMTTLCMGI